MADPSFANNPFTVLTAIVAPAILTNACSVMSLGTGNRIARVVDRTRMLSKELTELTPASPDYNSHLHQLALLQQRAQLLFRCLRLFYFSLGCFVASALIAILGSVMSYYQIALGFEILAGLGLAIGIFGVASLVWGSGLMVAEVRVALEQIAEEASQASHTFS
ncbi:MAG TPA: DUF2721 domain-containing protein [Bryobacteraceae bacterium]|nr:DUF2721 domain-containing protein [Bryobacteraceae bacterium]